MCVEVCTCDCMPHMLKPGLPKPKMTNFEVISGFMMKLPKFNTFWMSKLIHSEISQMLLPIGFLFLLSF